MSVNFKLDPKAVNRVINALRNVENASEEAVFKKAINETAKFAKKELSSKAKSVYAGPQSSGISGRATIKKATTSNLGAVVIFGQQSRVPSIMKFKVSPKATPTRFLKQGRHRQKIGSSYRMVGKQKKYNLRTSQFRSGNMNSYKSGFIATMGSGRTGVFVREGGMTSKGKAKLKQILGSTDRAMVRNEKVYPEVEPKLSEKLNEQMEAALAKALGGK